MGMYVQRVPVKFKTGTIVVGTNSYVDVMGFPNPMTVTAIVGSSGSVAVYYSTTPKAAELMESANWIAWPSGTVSANTSNALIAPVAGIKFVATTANGTYELVA